MLDWFLPSYVPRAGLTYFVIFLGAWLIWRELKPYWENGTLQIGLFVAFVVWMMLGSG